MGVATSLFDGKKLAIETYKSNVIKEIGDQSQDALLRVCNWKEDLNGTGLIWITIMGASKAIRRNDKYSMVGFSKGNKTRRVQLLLEEVIARDLFTDMEKKQTNIAFEKEIAKNQADSIKVERNFNIIDAIESEVAATNIISVDKTSAGAGYNTFYNDVTDIITHLIGMGVPIHMVMDRHGWSAIMKEEKFINKDYYGAYLAQNGKVDGMMIEGAKVALLNDIEEEVYGQDSYLDEGVIYFIGENSIALGTMPDLIVRDGWSDYWAAYVLTTISYIGCRVVKPRLIVKLTIPAQDKYKGLGGKVEAGLQLRSDQDFGDVIHATPTSPSIVDIRVALDTYRTGGDISADTEVNLYAMEMALHEMTLTKLKTAAKAAGLDSAEVDAVKEAGREELEKDVVYNLYPLSYAKVYPDEV